MTATAPTVSGMTLAEAINRHLVMTPNTERITDAEAAAAYTGTGTQSIILRHLLGITLDYFTRGQVGGVVKFVKYASVATTLNVRTTAATTPSSTTYNMAVNVRGAGDYEGRAFSLRGDGLVIENGKSVSFGSADVYLDIWTGPVFNTAAADDATAWKSWFEDIDPGAKIAIVAESVQKWRMARAPDPQVDGMLDRDLARALVGVRRHSEERMGDVVAPAPTPFAGAVGGQGRGS